MMQYPETFEVEHFDGRKGLLNECRVDSSGAIFSRGEVDAIGIGDLLLRTLPNGYTERLKVKWIASKASGYNGSIELRVEAV
ncbi:hypothetical protein VXR09_11140 [Acinetobacter baumannii]|nr:hypothetical protein [Acinetobacter baumannii]MCT9182128.1 hypothetical protein [Acinetobacter baumannii]MCT9223604.1 hypothetical protein [Acinetobacter baumannii]MCT9275026.1 hypothetical protein [Acinetobacter baumannii]MCW1473652.1 hypothetical protein [Acinetobacter baumannii]MCX3005050.1 hypothetical protein [Acinetobacter baumannii]